MRKLISLLIIALIGFVTSFAQNESEHLKFKGVPIDGTLSEYVSKMKHAGFTYIGTQEGSAILKGDFAGFKGCRIGVSTLKSTDMVNTIAVMFPKQEDWVSLEDNYTHLKSMLTEKYGEPSDCVEIFQGDNAPSTDSSKMIRVMTNRYTWYTTFSTPKGNIQLSIDNQDVTCYVLLRYFDRINTDTVRKQAMDDL